MYSLLHSTRNLEKVNKNVGRSSAFNLKLLDFRKFHIICDRRAGLNCY